MTAHLPFEDDEIDILSEAKAPSTAPEETKPAESSTIRVVLCGFLGWAWEMGHDHDDHDVSQ